MTKKEEKELDKQIRKHQREQRREHKQELQLLRYMKKTGLKYYHHNTCDDMIDEVKAKLKKCRDSKPDFDRDPWLSYRLHCASNLDVLFGCTFTHPEFDSIYDVPQDGLWTFHIYDSGQRGLGAKNKITATRNIIPDVPKVNPGGIPPITA